MTDRLDQLPDIGHASGSIKYEKFYAKKWESS
jgi:hypothetical protein